jgi:hypothetical protein
MTLRSLREKAAPAALLLAALCSATPASAQPKKPTAPAGKAQPPAAPAPPPPPAPTPAAPQDPDPAARARDLKKSGDVAMDSLRFGDAYAAYSDTYAITLDPALLYNMGRALQALNRFPEALSKLESFDAMASAELKSKVPRLAGLIADMRKRVSTVTVKSNVNGARILVRNTVVGKAPLDTPLKLVAGKAEVEVEADGYFPFRDVVDLPGGGSLLIDARLFSRTTNGIVSVRASAPGSEVYVGEKRAGIAPIEMNVARGTHKIVIRNPDYRDFETSVVVAAGERKEVSATLLPPSIASRWWFWTSIGAGLAAGAAITVIVLTEGPPDRGDIDPGQITAPAAIPGLVPVLEF